MTRKEITQNASKKWTKNHGAKGEAQISLDCIQEVAFESGVEWADCNPEADHLSAPILTAMVEQIVDLNKKLSIAVEALEWYESLKPSIYDDCAGTALKLIKGEPHD